MVPPAGAHGEQRRAARRILTDDGSMARLIPLTDKLASFPPREMRRALHAAFGSAKLAGRADLSPDDIQDGRVRKQRIGF